MNKTFLLAAGLGALLVQGASAQTVTNLVNSWENSLEGWSTDGVWTSGGFSTTTGVTQGSYSWVVNASSNPDYNLSFGGPASTALTAELANSTEVQVDVYTVGGSFSLLQWDLFLNNSDAGLASADGDSFSQSPVIGSESTLTFVVDPAQKANLSDPSSTTSLNFEVGGTGTGAVYLDNLRIIDPIPTPEPSVMALAGVGVLGLIVVHKRRHRQA